MHYLFLEAIIGLEKQFLVFFFEWRLKTGLTVNAKCVCSAVRTACDIQVVGMQRTGRLMMTLKKLSENDCHEWKFTAVNIQ